MHVTLKLGVALELLLQLGNHKSHYSDFCVVWDVSIALSLSDCLGPKKGTSILVRVAKLLRLSIVKYLGGQKYTYSIIIASDALCLFLLSQSFANTKGTDQLPGKLTRTVFFKVSGP